MPGTMLAQHFNAEDEEGAFGFFVGLDESESANNNVFDTERAMKQQTSTDTKLGTLSTVHSSSVSIVSAELVTKAKSSNTVKNNEQIVNEIEERINYSQTKMMDMMQSLFNEVMEGQKRINNNLERISHRVDYIERATSKLSLSNSFCKGTLSSSTSDTTNECSGIISFLRNVKISDKILSDLITSKDIELVAELSQTKTFSPGQFIIREDAICTHFYMMKEGYVNCYKKSHGAQPLRTLTGGCSFCDEATSSNTYIANSEVECLCLPIFDFMKIFKKTTASESNSLKQSMKNAKIDDFEIIRVLGTGNFSTVQLAQFKSSNKKDSKLVALKCFKSKVKNGSDHKSLHIMIENEKRITSQLDSPFIVQFYGSLQSAGKLFFILEAMVGGDLYNLLQKKTKFPEDWVRFYAASVLQAFSDIHAYNIAFRDLKPENLILNDEGYIKMIDFGLAKKFDDEEKTYTCCGTLDYLAPEIILKTGHDMAVDNWALGILIYEMAAGDCPFMAKDQVQTCKTILSGKIKFPSNFSPTLCEMIKGFLQRDPTKRLGCKDYNNSIEVKNHQWFQGFDWNRLVRRESKAPYVPKIND